jgi:hypothetical protein
MSVASANLVPMTLVAVAHPPAAQMVGGTPRASPQKPKRRKPAAKAAVSTAGVARAPFVPPGDLPGSIGWYRFEDKRGQSVCWRLGRDSAAEFVEKSGAVGMGDQLFHTNKVKIFYPIADEYFATRSVSINGSATASRVLKAIEQTAQMATAFHLQKDLSIAHPTASEVAKELSGAVVCHLMCKRVGGGNHVYVRLTS